MILHSNFPELIKKIKRWREPFNDLNLKTVVEPEKAMQGYSCTEVRGERVKTFLIQLPFLGSFLRRQESRVPAPMAKARQVTHTIH